MFSAQFLHDFVDTVKQINPITIEEAVSAIKETRELGGKLFILGAGGSAATASHAVNDFRKICGVEAYAPTDNVSELTARTNDEGWESVFMPWLTISHLSERDSVLFLSVGGGDIENNVSINLVNAALIARERGAVTIAIVGRYGGELGKIVTHTILVPNLYPAFVTPITEAMHAVILHSMVSNPLLKINDTKW